MSIPWSQHPFPPKPLPGQAIEEVARAARSQLLFDAMRQHECDVLVMGHHADDQVETVLMRLLRQYKWTNGSSSALDVTLHNSVMRSCRRWGMGFESEPGSLAWAGRPGMNKWVVRPLLSLPKDRLIATCEAQDLDYVQDVTNFNPALTPRNAIRSVLAGRDEAKALPNAEIHEIRSVIDNMRTLALTAHDDGELPPAKTTSDVLRTWVGGLEKFRDSLDNDVDRILSDFSAPSPPSTLLLRTNSIIQNKVQLSKAQKHALIRRILRYVSPKAWGSTEAEASGRAESLDKISEHLFKEVSPGDASGTFKFSHGGNVLWKLVKIRHDGSIRTWQPMDGGRQGLGVGWLAYRTPPRSSESSTQMEVTSIVRRALADPSLKEKIEVLWDCRFALTLSPWLLPDEVKAKLTESSAGSSVVVHAVGELSLPKVVMRRGDGQEAKVVLGGWSKRSEELFERPWIDFQVVRDINAL
ncbi:hypothetical protein FRB90_001872 [Tulasnella sp. 427]|nr:hypothetical protein FRB90_001872 [Tulasnella sp. 427]